ncbi:MAG: hypothetical protein ACM3KM_00585 [Acidobacteriaceae bacterium]
MWFVCLVAYLVLGCLISVPYTLLAGWNPVNFVVTAVLAPAAVLAFWGARYVEQIEWMGDCVVEIWNGEVAPHPKFRRSYSWFVLGYFFLPIGFNLVSVALRVLGLSQAADTVWGLRYGSLIIALSLVIAGLLILAAILPLSRAIYRSTFWVARKIGRSPSPQSLV